RVHGLERRRGHGPVRTDRSRSEEVEAHPGQQRRLATIRSHQPVRGAVGALHEHALLQLAGEEEVAAEIEVEPDGSAAGGADIRVGIDRRDADSDGEKRAEEEALEEVVFEGGFSDLSERGVLAGETEADS